MQVIHNDAASIHLVSDDLTAAVTGIGSESPRLALCRRVPGERPSELYSGTITAGRRLPAQQWAAPAVRSFIRHYVDSGALDSYRQAQGLPSILERSTLEH